MQKLFLNNRLFLSLILLSILSFLIILIGGYWGAGFETLWREKNLFFLITGPFIVVSVIVGVYFLKSNSINSKILWRLSFITTILLSFYFLIIGYQLAQLILLDEEHLSRSPIAGIWVSGSAFMIILFPVALAIARVSIGIFCKIINKKVLSK